MSVISCTSTLTFRFSGFYYSSRSWTLLCNFYATPTLDFIKISRTLWAWEASKSHLNWLANTLSRLSIVSLEHSYLLHISRISFRTGPSFSVKCLSISL